MLRGPYFALCVRWPCLTAMVSLSISKSLCFSQLLVLLSLVKGIWVCIWPKVFPVARPVMASNATKKCQNNGNGCIPVWLIMFVGAVNGIVKHTILNKIHKLHTLLLNLCTDWPVRRVSFIQLWPVHRRRVSLIHSPRLINRIVQFSSAVCRVSYRIFC